MSPETVIYVKIGGKKYTLPVNPENISVSHPHVDKTAEVAGVGEILIPQKPGLREITFDSFFPGDDYDPYTHDYRNPRTLAKAFEKAWKNRTKCRLIIARSIDYDTNMQCLITDWRIEDRGGEPNDLYYSIAFREYRSFGVSQMTVVNENAVVTGPGANLTAADGQLSQVVTVSTETVRSMDTPHMVVGAFVILNGNYYQTSQGGDVAGVANSETGVLYRIDSGNPAPYYINGLGWFSEESVKLGA